MENFVINNRISRRVKTEGETLERKIERLMTTKEPLNEPNKTAPLIYTDRKEGIRASTNIRTDRFEIAVEAMDVVSKTRKAKREERAKGEVEVKPEVKGPDEPKP